MFLRFRWQKCLIYWFLCIILVHLFVMYIYVFIFLLNSQQSTFKPITSAVADPGFPRGGGANSPGGGANIRNCQIFWKTAWNRKNLDPQGGGASLAPPLRSANDLCFWNYVFTLTYHIKIAAFYGEMEKKDWSWWREEQNESAAIINSHWPVSSFGI